LAFYSLKELFESSNARARRQKISHDPNNTTWARDTAGFGHKILTSQGWKPGKTLGATDSAHAKHFTVASSSHVRIALREENLGLGAKIGSGQGAGECTGLDSFQDLLGRLNGKSEGVIEKEKKGRDDVRRVLYADRKYGGWGRFVSAGIMMGDKMLQKDSDPQQGSSSISDATKTAVHGSNQAPPELDEGSQDIPDPGQRVEKKKKKMKGKNNAIAKDSSNGPEHQADTALDGFEPAARETCGEQDDKVQRRAAKAQRKLDRQKRREERKIAREAKTTNSSKIAMPEVAATSLATTLPAMPSFSGGRHAVRQRYIMQKKAALMDSKALNEVSHCFVHCMRLTS
jgi:Pin2-interacting protein X1